MWTHPPDLVTVTLAAFVVNLRLALMGPVLAPWLSQVTGWRLWGGLFMVSDQNWALSVREMNNGGRDVGYLMGGGIAMWSSWTASTVVGQLVGAFVRPAPGHPLFFAALAAFVCMLTGMWRGRGDLVPWAVATCVSIGVAQLLPGTFWYIVAGALAGSITGGLRDVRR
jgi:predicted branched-subunit amino acid permease